MKDWKPSPSKGAGRSSGGVGAPGDGAPPGAGAPGAGTPGNGEFPGADCVEGRARVGDGDGAPGVDGVWTVMGESLSPSGRASRLRAWAERPCPGACGSRPEGGGRDRGETPCPGVVRVAHGCCAVLLRSFTLYYAPFNRTAGPSCRGGGRSPPRAGARRGGMPARWCGWGSWDDSGRAVVQICCKGAPGRDGPRMKVRNINDSLPVAPARSGPLQQIWTNGAAAGLSEGCRGPDGDLAGRVADPGVL